MYFQNIDSAIQVPHDSDDYCYDDWLLLLCTPRECHIYVIPGGLEQENVIQQNSNFSIIGFSQNMSLILSVLRVCVQLEQQSRKLFLWKIGVRDQKERVFEMRRWNEALVTNMLPEHVAKHFLGTKKRDEVYMLSLLP